jgi:hypothetical protein
MNRVHEAVKCPENPQSCSLHMLYCILNVHVFRKIGQEVVHSQYSFVTSTSPSLIPKQ